MIALAARQSSPRRLLRRTSRRRQCFPTLRLRASTSPDRRTLSSRPMGRFTPLTKAPTALLAAGSIRPPCSARSIWQRKCGAIPKPRPTPCSTLNRRAAAASARRSVSPALPIWTWSAIPTWARCRIWPALSFTRRSASPISSLTVPGRRFPSPRRCPSAAWSSTSAR